MAGDAGVTLRVVGQRFRPSSVMRWNGNDRPTRVISETEFEADLSAVDLLVAQRARLAVISPALEGGSAEVEFAVYNPTPVITGISPTRRGIGGASFTLTVTGAQFVPGAVVTWNGQPRPTTFTSAAQVTATIASSDLASGCAVPVAIRNPDPAVAESAAETFLVEVPLVIDLHARDLAWDSVRNRLYASEASAPAIPDRSSRSSR